MRLPGRASLVVLAVAALVGASCARTLEEIAPFPCANDRTCPDGFTCVGGTTCRPGRALDAACATGDRCAEGDCVAQRCVPRCVAGATCAGGRVCSYPPGAESAPGAYCLLDCAATPCPAGLECQPLYGERKGCVTRTASASLDKPCDAPQDCQTRYGVTYLPITCARGTCATFCADGVAPCADPRRRCHVGEPVIQSGCLLDCGGGGACPEGLACKVGEPSLCASPAAP